MELLLDKLLTATEQDIDYHLMHYQYTLQNVLPSNHFAARSEACRCNRLKALHASTLMLPGRARSA